MLKDIITKIKDYAVKLPNVNSAYDGSIYKLNELPDVKYANVFVTQQQHRIDNLNQQIHYQFNVFYVDVQTSDGNNKLDIQSHGVSVLTTILNMLDNEYIIDDGTIDTFEERFSSLCAGAFLTIGIVEDLPLCGLYEE